MSDEALKVCNGCLESLPYTAFRRKAANGPMGIDTRCRQCRGKEGAAYYRRNKARITASCKSYYQTHKAQTTATVKAWRQANPEKVKAYQRLHYQMNREDYIARARAREQTPAGLIGKAHARHRRRARLRAVVSGGTREQRAMVLARAGGRCEYCASPAKLTIDHIVPIALGGSDTPSNWAAACLSCNASKQDRALEVWLPAKHGVAALERYRARRSARVAA